MKKTFLPGFTTLILLTLFASVSFAAIEAPEILNSPGLQSEASESFNVAHKIFGSAWEIATRDDYNSNEYSTGIMASISETLTLVALLLVSVLVAWTITTSSVNVVSTGQSTANQYSGFWLPFRTGMSVLLLVPIAGGYATIQIIVLAVASWGMNAGDAVWQASLDHLFKTPSIQTNNTGLDNRDNNNILGGTFLKINPTLPIEDLFNTMICYEFIRTLDKKELLQEESRSVNGYKNIANPYKVSVIKHHPHRKTERITANYPGQNTGKTLTSTIQHQWGTSKYNNLCGTLRQQITIPYSGSGGSNYTEQEYLAWQNIVASAFNQFYQESGLIVAAQSAQLFFSDQGITKKQFMNSFSVEGLALAYKKYQETVVKGSIKLLAKNQKNQKFVEAAKKSGWFYAGGFYWGIKSINEEVQSILSQSEPKFIKKVTDLNKKMGRCDLLSVLDWDVSCRSPWKDYLFLANGYPANSLKKMYLSTEFFSTEVMRVVEKERFEKQDWAEAIRDLDNGVGHPNNDKSLLNKAMDELSHITGYGGGNGNIITKAMTNSKDPLSELQNAGHNMIIGGTLAYIGVAKTAAIYDAAINATVLGNSVGRVAQAFGLDLGMVIGFFQTIIAFTFVVGILFAYYLPMIPLITWVSAVVGYVTFLFEAFIGSIFWAGAHAMPEGEGVAGQHAKQGYMLMFSLIVRPALMVVGLIGGIFISQVLINFAGELATPYVSQVHGNSVVGPIGWVATVFIISSIGLSIIRRSFNLCYELADRVVRWVGHSGERLGEDQEEAEIKQRFLLLAGKIGFGAKGVMGVKDTANAGEGSDTDSERKKAGQHPL